MRLGHLAVWGVVGVVLVGGGLGPRPAIAQEDRRLVGVLEIYDVLPPQASVRLRPGEREEFAVWAAGTELTYRWTLDEELVGARRSVVFEATAERLGRHRLAVDIVGAQGRASRSWTIDVEDDGSSPTTISSTSSTSSTSSSTTTTFTSITTTTTSTTRAPATTTTRPTTTSTRTPTTTTASTTTTTTPPGGTGAISVGEVRTLLDRYAAAWEARDVDALERVGQVATAGQAAALKSYFEGVEDLDVEVTVLDIQVTGDEARVRFVRRERFRDPSGRVVTNETPPQDKRVVRTPGGLRFAPLR